MYVLLRLFFVFLLISFFSTFCLSQKTNDFRVGASTPPPPPKKSNSVSVKFSSNADCRININGINKGTVLKGKPRSIPLKPGQNIIKAVNPITGDLYLDTVIIRPNHPVIFIPLEEVQRAREKGSGAATNVEPGKVADGAISEAQKILNEIFANLVLIEGGVFSMGNNVGAPDARPEHPVQLRQFYISKYEVTQKQWQALTGTNPSINADCDECPVENITENEAQLFLNKINALSTRKARLPSEAEWEYVAKKGGGVQNLDASVWYAQNSSKATQPVGKKAPNELGIYDLFGNVAEWCRDWYDAGYYKNSPPVNPMGPMDGREKVVRGGSYEDGSNAFHPAARQKQSWFGRRNTIGLRIVLD
jgi:formylglycine-generating enzyme required for sulfatase activity